MREPPRLWAFLGLLLVLMAPRGACAAEEPPKDGGEDNAALQASLQEVVAQLRPIVSRIRHLAWKADVPAKVITRAELGRLLIEDLEHVYPASERERDHRVLRRLGLLREGESLLTFIDQLNRGLVAGFYDSRLDALYVVEGPQGKALWPTLVHELIHALDDQHYDLGARLMKVRDDSDLAFSLSCAVEGCAVHGQRLYAAAHPGVAEAEALSSAGEGVDFEGTLDAVPAIFLLDTLLHYRVGPELVTAQSAAGPVDLVHLFEHGPTTQEQWLHPERWKDPHRRDLPRHVEWAEDWVRVAGAGWRVLNDHTVGELDLALWLDFFLGGDGGKLTWYEMATGAYVSEAAWRAASGWDGGRMAYLERPGQPIAVLAAFAFDAMTDCREAVQQVLGLLRARHGSEVVFDALWKEEPGGGHSLRYRGPYGAGALQCQDRRLFWLDGMQANDLARVWPALLRTQFVQAEGDAGDRPGPDPFEGCAFVDRRRGLGWRLPQHWSVHESDDVVLGVAVAQGDGFAVKLFVAESGTTQADLEHWILTSVPNAKAEHVRDFSVNGYHGLLYPLSPTGAGRRSRIGLPGPARSFLLEVTGPWDPVADPFPPPVLRRVLEGVVSIPGY